MMGSRHIVSVREASKLSLRGGSLVVESGGELQARVAIEDIEMILLESQAILLTGALLSFCAQRGVAVVGCDATHTPCSLTLPLHGYSRAAQTQKEQMGWGERFRSFAAKRLIQSKILNQARCFSLVEGERNLELEELAQEVKGADCTRRESIAARRYMLWLLGGGSRRNGGELNGALNYGYAVMRAKVAQSIACAGLLGSLGLVHDNQLNSFNLADDLMEPFRPFIDYVVLTRLGFSRQGGCREMFEKRKLLSQLDFSVMMQSGKRMTLDEATEAVVRSLREAGAHKRSGEIDFPVLDKLRFQRYYE